MARIAGVDLPVKKRSVIGLTYIYGIGRTRALSLLFRAKVDPEKKIGDLSEEEVNHLRTLIESEGSIEGDLRKEVSMNIKRLMEMGSYRGLRHRRGLPARGQRTHTNAHSQRPAQGHRSEQKESDGKNLNHGEGSRKDHQEEKLQKEGKEERSVRDCAHSGFVQQHHRHVYRSDRERAGLVEFRFARVSRFAQGHAFRRATGFADRCQQS
jgi:small subunit ribosomal protein S13